MALPPYSTLEDRFWYYTSRLVCAAVLAFLVSPILVIAPISFTSGNLLAFPMPGFSLKWYWSLIDTPVWWTAALNSLVIGVASSVLAMLLGTTAAIGIARSEFAAKPLIVAVILSPILVPIVITAVGIYFAFAATGLSGTYTGLIMAHTVLAVPFVVITVMASLENFDHTLIRAANSLGAGPVTAFRRVTLPIVLPGIASGGLFAFATSFDEIVVTLFLAAPDQRTLPRQLFSGVREYVSPGIAAVATLLIVLSAVLLSVVQLLSRRSNQLMGRE